ncbi:bifunctional 3-phenylpropionate/cinnamic acid dioxygenase ferredoxin subunit [Streptomyces sp. NPDC002205]|uniref:bifunctional 3-phenylpropionate/cinnamic acid dioxygenase ferredoxin subunit n=1 Tax=Streptomyces sp. NPDC002205 TaxID=3154411 RepID=UPI0033192330
MQGIRVAAASDIDEGDAVTVDAAIAGTRDNIAVFHSDNGNFYALDDTCTHETASLADGWVEGTEVECPIHSAKFCLLTGKALCLPATRSMTTHRVEVRDGDLYLYPSVTADAQ